MGYWIYPDLGPDLEAGDKILMHQRIKDQPALHGVSGQKENVRVAQAGRRAGINYITDNRFEPDIRLRPARYPLSNGDLRAGQALAQPAEQLNAADQGEKFSISPGGTNDPGQIRRFNAVGVYDDKMADPQVGEHLSKQGSAAASTNNADLEFAEPGLPEIIEETRVTIVNRIDSRALRVQLDSSRSDRNHGRLFG